MRSFFFAPESVRPLARVRVLLAAVLLFEAAGHWPYSVELYSTAGPALPVFLKTEIIPGAPLDENGRFPRRTVSTFHLPVPDPLTAIALSTGRLFALLGVMLGWKTRLSLVLACGLSLSLGLLDGTNFAKHSVISLHGLSLLACSRCGQWASLDALIHNADRECPLQAAWPRRLIQLLVCHVYLGAALTKLRTPSFFTGELLTFSLLDHAWGGGHWGQWVATQHTLVVLLSLATVLIELLFPFLVWFRQTRWVMLSLAGALHVAAWLLLHIGVFSPVMLGVLLAFVDEHEWAALSRSLAKRAPRLRWPNRLRAACLTQNVTAERAGAVSLEHTAVAPRLSRPTSMASYLLASLLCVGVGLAIQVWRDDYAVFGRRQLPRPERLPPLTVDEMLWPVDPAPGHWIHQVELGSRMQGTQVFGSGSKFRTGDRVFVAIRFLRTHPALTLEGLLIGPDRQETARFSVRVDPGVPAIVRGFELLEPVQDGTHLVIVQANGHEVARRVIEVHNPGE